jgi:glutamyl-tRNA synthetase
VQAVTEYLLNLANSDFYDWRKANPTLPNTDFEVRLDKMQVSSGLFDPVKLNDISKDVVATYSAQQVYDHVLAWAQQYDIPLAELLAAQRDFAVRVFNVERTGEQPRKDIVNWSDVRRACGFFFDSLYAQAITEGGYPFPSGVPKADIIAILQHMTGFDMAMPKDDFIAGMRAYAETNGFARDMKSYKKDPTAFKGHFGDVMMVVRVALSGKTNTPDLYEIIHTIGRDALLARLGQASAWAQEHLP